MRYARNGEVSLAYDVLGDGPLDVVLTTGWVLPMSATWEQPRYARFVERLASFARVVMWDKRGTGMSDRVSPERLPTLQDRVEDLTAVLDACGSERPTLFGLSEGALVSALHAARNQHRVGSLVLYGGWASSQPAGDSPGLMPIEVGDAFISMVAESWENAEDLLWIWAPEAADDQQVRSWWADALHAGASPAAAVAWLEMTREMDIRSALADIACPTLVLHRVADPMVPVTNSRYLASRIAGARLVEVEGDAHLWWFGDEDVLLDEVEEFLTGARGSREHQRAVLTVLFTDITGSTSRLAEIGDRRWRDLLSAHEREVARQIARFGGRRVKTLGDGAMATFDGPGPAIRCASAIHAASTQLGLAMRTGLHTGEVELIAEDLSGIAVNIAARVGALAAPGEILVSSTVRDLVAGSTFEFADRGSHELKGVPDEWRLFSVTSV